MVFGTLTDSSRKGDGKVDSHLVKMQKVFRLGLFATNPATNPVRQADKDPVQVRPTNLNLNTPACEVLSVIDIRRHSVDTVTSTNLSFIDPWETHALSSRVEHWATQNPGNARTTRAVTRPPSPVKVKPERLPEQPAITRTTNHKHSLQSAQAPSKANSRLITEPITVEPHSMSTSSRKPDRVAKRQCSRSRPPKSSLPPESGGASVVSKRSRSSNRRAAPVEPPPLFPMDSFLPRAKPPSPLKLPTKHQRSRSLASVASPPSPTLRPRPQTPYQSSKLSEPASFFPVPDMTLPIPPLPPLPYPARKSSLARTPCLQKSNPQLASSQGSMQASDIPALTRTDTGLTATSAGSATSESAVTPSQFAPAWTWAPPPSWAGPRSEGDQVMGVKPKGTSKLIRKHSAKGKPNGCKYSNAHLNLSSTSLWRSRSPDPAEVGTPAEPSVRKAGQKSPDVVVKMKGIQGNEWHERAMAEVIPKLRALKTSR